MFNDRFTRLYAGLSGIDLNTLTDATTASNFPDLFEMVSAVRRHSVLLKKKTVAEIYYAITEHADPRIALVLAAARDPEGGQMFPSISSVEEFMFGTTGEAVVTTYVSFQDRTLFTSGIQRISAALAASVLIGQLAQIQEQANHAITLEKEALADLDRILLIPRVDTATNDTTTTDDEYKVSFYFEADSFSLSSNSRLETKVYLSSNLMSFGWNTVSIYDAPQDVSTQTLVAEITETINSITFSNVTAGGLVASPILNDSLHKIEVGSRDRDFSVKFNVISIDFIYSDLTSNERLEIPFRWGIDKTDLNFGYIKSSLVKVDKNTKSSTLSLNDLAIKNSLNVLYIRRISNVNEDGILIDSDNNLVETYSDSLKYRISPPLDHEESINIPTDIDPLFRPSAIAEQILASLYQARTKDSDIIGLGAIVRNDCISGDIHASAYPILGDRLVAIELVAYTVSIQEQWLILDLLDIPKDIEVAIGNLVGPVTRFSNRPRSIRVQAFYDSSLVSGQALGEGTFKLVKAPKSKINQSVQDIKNNYEINRYYESIDRYLVQPPNLVQTYEY